MTPPPLLLSGWLGEAFPRSPAADQMLSAAGWPSSDSPSVMRALLPILLRHVAQPAVFRLDDCNVCWLAATNPLEVQLFCLFFLLLLLLIRGLQHVHWPIVCECIDERFLPAIGEL